VVREKTYNKHLRTGTAAETNRILLEGAILAQLVQRGMRPGHSGRYFAIPSGGVIVLEVHVYSTKAAVEAQCDSSVEV